MDKITLGKIRDAGTAKPDTHRAVSVEAITLPDGLSTVVSLKDTDPDEVGVLLQRGRSKQRFPLPDAVRFALANRDAIDEIAAAMGIE